MPPQLTLHGKTITIALHATQGRQGIKLWFEPGSSVLQVRAPGGRLGPEAEAFIRKKADWILKTHSKISPQVNQFRQFMERIDQGEVLYMGRWRDVALQPGAGRPKARFLENGKLLLSGNTSLSAQNILAATQALAKPYLHNRTLQWADYTGHRKDISRISIRSQQSRWGSRSSSGSINLNWRLALMHPDMSDYVIIHELMHIREMNHSPAFWAHVESYCPDYKQLKKRVMDFGWSMAL
ncbi:MAG: YgjP-like metallopeptidase domain-containing protein [Bacteroidia bacterium]